MFTIRSIVASVAIGCCPLVAAAQQFSIGAVDASNGTVVGGVVGTGIDIVGGTIYQDPAQTLGATGEPLQVGIGLEPYLEFDTYLTIDTGPVEAAPGYNGADVTGVFEAPGSSGFTSASYRGSWAPFPSFVDAVANTKPGVGSVWEIFLGRITHTGTLQGTLDVAFAEPGEQPNFKQITGDLVTESEFSAGLGRISSDSLGNPLAMSPTHVVSFIKKEFQHDINGTTYTVSDIYIQSLPIPGPGVMGLVLLSGAYASRRRR